MKSGILIAGLASLAFALPAYGQTTFPRPSVIGTIESFDGHALTVKKEDGQTVVLNLTPKFRVISDDPLDLKTIKAGDSIGIDTTMENGKPKAFQVHTQDFPHGNAEGQRKLANNSNATRNLGVVSAVAPTANGVMVTVALLKNSGTLQTELTNDILHYRLQVQSAADLKPKMTVMANINKAADGGLTAGVLTVEKDGHKPVDRGD